MNLVDLQTNFQERLLAKECIGTDWIADSETNLSNQQRIGIYHNAYRVRLVDVLMDNFEHTSLYLGEEWFYKLGHEYVERYNSTHHNIAEYGKFFPEFLAKALPQDLEVSELATIDWSLRRAFDGLDGDALSNHDLQKLIEAHGGNTKLSPVPTTKVVKHKFNTLDIWQSVNNETIPPMVETLEHPVDILIWRKGFSPHFRSINNIENAAIKYLLESKTLDQIGELLTQEFQDIDVTTEFGLMMQRWVADEVLAR